MRVPPVPRPGTTGRYIETYTQGLTTAELERLFTFDTPEAYRFFSRQIDRSALKRLPWYRRAIEHGRLLFLAFTLKLSPARRALYGVALLVTLVGLLELVNGISLTLVPHPVFARGTLWVMAGFGLMNLLVLLEVVDRLSLKNDLEVARQIQQAMLPRGAYHASCVEAFGMTRPANTVGGDFYDIVPRPDGRVLLALGDVAGKGSPAALLMALVIAMMRTLIDEGLHGAELVSRLNAQVLKHAPSSRFITLFAAMLTPATGELVYVNAGQNPPLLRRASGEYERLRAGGIALGLFPGSSYVTGHAVLDSGDVLVMYSDGITEAEDMRDEEFGNERLEALQSMCCSSSAALIRDQIADAVDAFVDEAPQKDDETLVIVRRA